MFATLLSNLQTLLSRNYLFAYFFPTLAFVFVNVLTAYMITEWMYGLVQGYFGLDGPRQSLVAAAVLIAIAAAAYVLASLGVPLREALEGKYLPDRLAAVLRDRHARRLDELDNTLKDSWRELRKLRASGPQWEQDLQAARVVGNGRKTSTYDAKQIRGVLDPLRVRLRGGHTVTAVDLAPAVTLLIAALKANSADLAANPTSDALDRDHVDLAGAIQLAVRVWESRVVRLFNERQFSYPIDDIAATSMGNVARTVAAYALSRYSMNLDIIWSRLQKQFPTDAAFHGVLQDAKTQLDFLVSVVWLTAGYCAIWVAVLPFLGPLYVLFLAIGIGGPLLVVLFYRVALQSHRSFAELLRASIDLYRLDLLKSLHLPLPAGAEEERQLWEALCLRIAYGDKANLALRHPA